MTSRRAFTVGTRGSRLALRQTELVVDALRRAHPDREFVVRTVATEGDRRPDASLRVIGGRGVFVKALESALLAGEIDLAVHSLKDVPTELAPGLTLAAVTERGDVRDALVSRTGARLAALPAGARVGSGSLRRAAQVLALRPDLRVVDIRGNVDTRLRKVTEGEVDAVLLAAAGLDRLGWLDRAAELLDPEVVLPAVGQAALTVEVRADDAELAELLAAVHHGPTAAATAAERAFLRGLGGGCAVPVGAYGRVAGGRLVLDGLVAAPDGSRTVRERAEGSAAEAESVGARLAEAVLAQGAASLLREAEP